MEISTKPMTATLVITLAVILTTLMPAYATVSRPCYARDYEVGYTTISYSTVMVSGDYIVYGHLKVEDMFKDGLYAAAHFEVYINGHKAYDVWYGVPDGGSSYINVTDVGDTIRGITEGYFGTLDSAADAEAYMVRYCPRSQAEGVS